MIFETERLRIRKLKETDKDLFFEMMGNPNVMLPIPVQPMSKVESDEKFLEFIAEKNPRLTNIWAAAKKENDEFIGLCGFLINDENDDELAYRLREKNWGAGYGTEIAKGLIEHGFNKMFSKKITADVNIENKKSVKILEKFMFAVKEFYNEKDQCTDRRYAIYKNI